MYGLINGALKDMLIMQFGEEKWQEVYQQSKIPEDSFLTMRQYDDETTYKLVGAASKVLDAPVDECMKMFGLHWIEHVATRNFAALMDATGSNTVGCLHNLNSLHDRIASTFLDYFPPEFQVKDIDVQSGIYHVHYFSERKGLTGFVTGLLMGLAQHYGDQLEILAIDIEDDGQGTHSIFKLSIS